MAHSIQSHLGPRAWLNSIVIAGLLLTTGCTLSPSRYNLIDLGVLPGDTSSQATDLNNHGQVVGFSTGPSGERAFVWDEVRGMQEVGDLPGGAVSSRANAINDAGQIVGKSSTWNNAVHAFLFTPGPGQGMRDLGDFPGGSARSEASDINASGHVVGTGHGIRQWMAFLWDPVNGLQDIGALSGHNETSEAIAINDKGEVVGTFDSNGTYAFIFDKSQGMRKIAPNAVHGRLIIANDIRSNGRIVGVGLKPLTPSTLSNVGVAFSGDRYTTGALPDLPGRPPTTSTDDSVANAVNEDKDVVGWSMDATGPKAVVWGYFYGMQDLNGLILENDPLHGMVVLTEAVAINNHGDIAANGVINGVVHGFLLKRLRWYEFFKKKGLQKKN